LKNILLSKYIDKTIYYSKLDDYQTSYKNKVIQVV
jgi:hypothetical protein